MRVVYVGAAPKPEAELTRRKNLLQQWALPSTQVDIVYAETGPASIESMYEEYLAIPQYAKLMVKMQQAGYDAAIVGCAGDPGLNMYRELCPNMLVVGPGMSSLHTAALAGRRLTLLTVTASMIPASFELVQQAGLKDRLASIRAVEIPVLELTHNREQTLGKLVKIGSEAMKQDRANVLVLGCMSMAFMQVAEEMQQALGIPVINPAKAALKMAEALVSSNFTEAYRSQF